MMYSDEKNSVFIKEVAKQLLPYVLRGLDEQNKGNQVNDLEESAYEPESGSIESVAAAN